MATMSSYSMVLGITLISWLLVYLMDEWYQFDESSFSFQGLAEKPPFEISQSPYSHPHRCFFHPITRRVSITRSVMPLFHICVNALSTILLCIPLTFSKRLRMQFNHSVSTVFIIYVLIQFGSLNLLNLVDHTLIDLLQQLAVNLFVTFFIDLVFEYLIFPLTERIPFHIFQQQQQQQISEYQDPLYNDIPIDQIITSYPFSRDHIPYVYKARYNNQSVAMKKLRSLNQFDDIINDIKNQDSNGGGGGKDIVKFYGRNRDYRFIIVEPIEYGSLHDIITTIQHNQHHHHKYNQFQDYDLKRALNIAKSASIAFNNLHENNIIHDNRDIEFLERGFFEGMKSYQDGIKNLVKQCLEIDPLKRPYFDEISQALDKILVDYFLHTTKKSKKFWTELVIENKDLENNNFIWIEWDRFYPLFFEWFCEEDKLDENIKEEFKNNLDKVLRDVNTRQRDVSIEQLGKLFENFPPLEQVNKRKEIYTIKLIERFNSFSSVKGFLGFVQKSDHEVLKDVNTSSSIIHTDTDPTKTISIEKPTTPTSVVTTESGTYFIRYSAIYPTYLTLVFKQSGADSTAIRYYEVKTFPKTKRCTIGQFGYENLQDLIEREGHRWGFSVPILKSEPNSSNQSIHSTVHTGEWDSPALVNLDGFINNIEYYEFENEEEKPNGSEVPATNNYFVLVGDNTSPPPPPPLPQQHVNKNICINSFKDIKLENVFMINSIDIEI
eukprot:gene2184-2687_t